MERTFTPDDQKSFAELSGDSNPMHMDPVAARRLMFGAPVVHGVHLLLWSLATWLAEEKGPRALRSLSVRWKKPARVGDSVRGELSRPSSREVLFQLHSGRRVSMVARWQFSEDKVTSSVIPNEAPPSSECRILPSEEFASASGRLPLVFPHAPFQKLFPGVPLAQGAALLATTRLVGMHLPGRHSLFSGLDVSFSPETGSPDLSYAVRKYDPRFGRFEIGVTASGMEGTVEAYLRAAPRMQPSFQEVAKRVKPDAFHRQRALIVGGSRGLGEVTTKLLAAGGADCTITYHRGKEDALRLAEEIGCQAAPLDVLANNFTLPEGKLPTHLYYFSTPRIDVGDRGSFDDNLLQMFCNYYVEGLSRLVAALRDLRGVFVPSSVFLDNAPEGFEEYVAAKKKCEELCANLGRQHPGIAFHTPRLPKLATDQTQVVRGSVEGDPSKVLLPELLALAARS